MKSTTPSNEQLEIDQLAEAEVERLQKQVHSKRYTFFVYYNQYLLIYRSEN